MLTFEEALALLRNRDEWNRLCEDEEQPIFQFLNKEFVDALAQYLKERKRILKSRKEIFEVGAGNGLLSEELRKRKINIVATDGGSAKIKPIAPVQILDYREAIRRFRPNIVLCSWMPFQEDWTPMFRRFKFVQEYILIGEAHHSGCSGTDKTWEHHPGFSQMLLEEISKWSLCRSDLPRRYSNSVVISFRRYE